MASEATCVFYGCQQAASDDGTGLCNEHHQQQWFTVPEAAGIWNVSERSVRDWIQRRGIVTAERRGRRLYLIHTYEFTKPHPNQRSRFLEPETMVTLLPRRWYLRWTRRWPIGLALLVVLVAIGVGLAVSNLIDQAFISESNQDQSAGVFVGDTPLSVEFEQWQPSDPVLIMVGQETNLGMSFTSTSPVAGDFYAAVSLKDPEGNWVDVRPLEKVHLGPGERGEASWQYAPGLVGSWDLVFGVWGFWEDGREPAGPIGNTGILEGSIVAFQQCLERPEAATTVHIERYFPQAPVEHLIDEDAELGITFTNSGGTHQVLSAGVTVWQVGEQDRLVGDYRSTTDHPLAPRETATMRWNHPLESDGFYQVMFSIWDANENILLRAPCPRQRLLVASSPQSPVVTGIEPDQPRSQPTRQWISIHGYNFTERSAVVLSIQGNRYPISRERTEFVSIEELRVMVGLTDPGTWSAQVANSEGSESEAWQFTVMP